MVQLDAENREVNGDCRIRETALNVLSRSASKKLRDHRVLIII